MLVFHDVQQQQQHHTYIHHLDISFPNRGMKVYVVNEFTYLGKHVNYHNIHDGEVVARIALALALALTCCMLSVLGLPCLGMCIS